MALNLAFIKDIAQQKILISQLDTQSLVQFCEYANQEYRLGQPIISDADYDFIYLPELAKQQPNHPLLQEVEAEGRGFSDNKYRLPEPMLSTDKAYTWTEVEKWLNRIKKSAQNVNISYQDIVLEITAKLDGFAGFDDGKRLYTRGDGKRGSNISRVFTRGLSIFENNSRGLGAGEIVVKKSYFQEKLTHFFDSPRNFQASIIKEKPLDKPTQQAIDDKAAVFVPFSTLPRWQGGLSEFSTQFQPLISQILYALDFDVDGVVLAVVNVSIQNDMGSTRKFHRWQLAFKENKDKAQVKVISITPQVGRTGKITPVVELVPTLLSGAILSRASAHHYGFIKKQQLGIDSVVELTRSGLVIPKINQVLKATQAIIPSQCPSCDTALIWQSDFLLCPNHQYCSEQIIASLCFFFATMGNNDGFGRATIAKLYTQGIDDLVKIYSLTQNQLMDFGFGKKTGYNLLNQLKKSTQVAVEDWRFLASFGINRLGQGNCERLLQHYHLADVFNLSVEQIANIEGFAQLSADAIVIGLKVIKPTFDQLMQQHFTLEITQLSNNNKQTQGFFSHKSIVFTGKMAQSRPEMIKKAKTLGFKVLSSVSKQCDYLVIGQKVSQSKLDKANQCKVTIITEQDYTEKLKYLL